MRSRNGGLDDEDPFSFSIAFVLAGVFAPYPLGCDVIPSLEVVLIIGVGFRTESGVSAELVDLEFWESGGPVEVMKLSGLGSGLP